MLEQTVDGSAMGCVVHALHGAVWTFIVGRDIDARTWTLGLGFGVNSS